MFLVERYESELTKAGFSFRSFEDCQEFKILLMSLPCSVAVAGEDELDSTSVSPPDHLLDSLKQLCSRTEEGAFSSVENLRIGLPREYLSDKMSPEVVAAWDLVASRLSDAGADVQLVIVFTNIFIFLAV